MVPIGTGDTARFGYSLAEFRPGIDVVTAAAFLRMVGPRLAIASVSGTDEILKGALAKQLLPLAEQYAPATIGDFRTAAGLTQGGSASPELSAFLHKLDVDIENLDADLASRADGETDALARDVLRFQLVASLLQSDRAGDAMSVLPKISDRELRDALTELTAYKTGEHFLRNGAKSGDAHPELREGLYSILLSLSAAFSDDAKPETQSAMALLDAVRKVDSRYRSALMSGLVTLIARTDQQLAVEVLRQAVVDANQVSQAVKQPAAGASLVNIAEDAGGFGVRVTFGKTVRLVRLQPPHLPSLSFAGALRSLRAADPAVLEEIAGKLVDDKDRAKAMTGVISVELAQAFGQK